MPARPFDDELVRVVATPSGPSSRRAESWREACAMLMRALTGRARRPDPNAAACRAAASKACYTPLSTARPPRGARERVEVAMSRHGSCIRSTRSRPESSSTSARARRRLPQGPASLPRPSRAEREDGELRRAAPARGHPVRRRLQHAAAADAVGHRSGRRARQSIGRGPPRGVGRTCRTATRWR